MPAKPSGEIKTSTIRSRQKNGDIYILERRTIYNPAKKSNTVLSTKLKAKIPKGSEIPVATRPKRSSCASEQGNSGILTASRAHVGMMDIIAHIGETSGIDDGIYGNTDTGTAQKIISVARYLLATNGQTLPGIQTWQFNHPIPYEHGISEDIYHDLFAKVGRDEALQQNFFLSRCEGLPEKAALAYDSTTVSTYSERQIEARYGFNKAEDGLKTVKLLTLYSIETRQPIAFTKQPGNLPDVITIGNALKQLSALGVRSAEIVTDNGYYSEKNLSEMFLEGFDFITLVKAGLKWVKAEIDPRMEELRGIASACPFDPGTHGVTATLMHGFEKTRKYANHRIGGRKGDTEIFSKRIYLHIYFNAMRQAEDKTAFESRLVELKSLLEQGIPADGLSEAAGHKADKYLNVRTRAGKVVVTYDDAACAEAYRYCGFFALVSNCEKDPFECLMKYRKRETIESFFMAEKQRTDGGRIRVWDSDTLRGRMFVQFVALCYYEYFGNEVRKLKQVLGKKNGDNRHDKKTVIDAENKLKSWLENTPIYLQLQWFDTVESVCVSAPLRAKRWSTEITARDRLFLEKLGVVQAPF
jgi:transposase